MLETLSERDKALAGYLLNELGEKELYALEDEMLMDEELSERMGVVEMNLIDGYVRDEMSAEERARFARRFLAVPENAEKVAAARAFHESLSRLREKESAPAASVVAPTPERRQTWGERVASLFRLPAPALALAALALVAVVLGLLWFARPRHRDERPNDIANTSPSPKVGLELPAPSPAPSEEPPSPPPADHDNENAPAPQRTPAAPKLQKTPALPREELAQLAPAGDTQDAWVFKVGGKVRNDRTGGGTITIKADKKTVRLRHQLLGDALNPQKERFRVSIEGGGIDPIFPTAEVSRRSDDGGRTWYLAVEVPAAALKDGVTYNFRIHDLGLKTPVLIKHARQ